MLIRHTDQDGELTPVHCTVLCADRGSLRHAEDLALFADGPAYSARFV